MKSAILWALITSSITACNPGGLDLEFNKMCRTDLVAMAGGTSAVLDCDKLDRNLRYVRELMTHDFVRENGEILRILKDDRDWDREMYQLTLHVGNGEFLADDFMGHTRLTGYYDGGQELLQISTDYGSLLHEFLHRYQSNRFDLSSMNHAGWTEKGYTEMSEFFASNVK